MVRAEYQGSTMIQVYIFSKVTVKTGRREQNSESNAKEHEIICFNHVVDLSSLVVSGLGEQHLLTNVNSNSIDF